MYIWEYPGGSEKISTVFTVRLRTEEYTWRPYFGRECYGFNANISFPFEAIKNLSAHPTNLRSGLFFFVGDFWGKIIFLKVLLKFVEKNKI